MLNGVFIKIISLSELFFTDWLFLVLVMYLFKDCMLIIGKEFMNTELLCKDELKQPP